MDSLALAPSAALKLVDVYQLSHDIKQLQLDSLYLSVEQKVANIFQATSTNIFHEGLKDFQNFIDEWLEIDESKYLDNTTKLKEKLLALKHILIQIQDQSNIQNV